MKQKISAFNEWLASKLADTLAAKELLDIVESFGEMFTIIKRRKPWVT